MASEVADPFGALPRVAAPPLAPLSIPQRNFLALHTRHVVDKWQWHFVCTQLRAFAGAKSATIWRCELDDLVERGLMQYGVGCADVRVTAAGAGLVMQTSEAAK